MSGSSGFTSLDQVAAVTPTAWPDAVKAFPGGTYSLSIQYKLQDGADQAAFDALMLHEFNLGEGDAPTYPYLVDGLKQGARILTVNSGVTYNEGRADGYQVASVFVLALSDHMLLSEVGKGAFKLDAAAFQEGFMQQFGITEVHAVAWLNGGYMPSYSSSEVVDSNVAFDAVNAAGVTKRFPTGCVTHQVH